MARFAAVNESPLHRHLQPSVPPCLSAPSIPSLHNIDTSLSPLDNLRLISAQCSYLCIPSSRYDHLYLRTVSKSPACPHHIPSAYPLLRTTAPSVNCCPESLFGSFTSLKREYRRSEVLPTPLQARLCHLLGIPWSSQLPSLRRLSCPPNLHVLPQADALKHLWREEGRPPVAPLCRQHIDPSRPTNERPTAFACSSFVLSLSQSCEDRLTCLPFGEQIDNFSSSPDKGRPPSPEKKYKGSKHPAIGTLAGMGG